LIEEMDERVLIMRSALMPSKLANFASARIIKHIYRVYSADLDGHLFADEVEHWRACWAITEDRP
jgi:hypothetical protein